MQVLISLTRFIIFLNIRGHKTITAWSTHSQKANTELWFVKQKENSDFAANSQLGVNFINWSLLKGVFLFVFGVVFGGFFFVVCLVCLFVCHISLLSTIRFKGNVLAHSLFPGSGFNYLEHLPCYEVSAKMPHLGAFIQKHFHTLFHCGLHNRVFEIFEMFEMLLNMFF